MCSAAPAVLRRLKPLWFGLRQLCLGLGLVLSAQDVLSSLAVIGWGNRPHITITSTDAKNQMYYKRA